MAAARRSGADAVHPGYGFLSQNADFAEAVARAGLVFVGPPAEVHRRMGDKAAARRLMASAGVPVLPGYDGGDQSDAVLAAEAARIGWPVMIKPSRGGGGKGMRMVGRGEDFASALAASRREAAAAFGDSRVVLERFAERPRHVEVQVLADTHGQTVHLFERECSIQRRHQKVVEESPSLALTPATRERPVRGRRGRRPRRRVRERRDRRVPSRRERRLLLSRDEHAPPGGASRHRGRHGARPGAPPARDCGRESSPVPTAGHRLPGPRSGVPTLRRRSGAGGPPLAGADPPFRGSRGPRRPPRLWGGGRLRGDALLRSAHRQAGRLGLGPDRSAVAHERGSRRHGGPRGRDQQGATPRHRRASRLRSWRAAHGVPRGAFQQPDAARELSARSPGRGSRGPFRRATGARRGAHAPPDPWGSAGAWRLA